jgi:hypothetical protein
VESNPVEGLQACFGTLTDPRKERARWHELLDIIILAISAIICDYNTWFDIAQFCRIRMCWFRSFPSHDTFWRVFARLNPLQFEQCFIL